MSITYIGDNKFYQSKKNTSMYSRLLANYPLTTKCVTSGFMFSLGDALTQKCTSVPMLVIEKKAEFDFKRNLNLILTGTFYLGPCLHVWYSKLLPQVVNRVVGASTASKFKPAFTGMLFDQLAFAPVFLTGFFVFANWVRDFSLSSAVGGVDLAKNKMGETMLTNWKIWPAATLVNLMFVPIQFRVLFANFIGLFWNMYLSFVTNN